jgi:AcrR family transcriptional regulator
MVATPWGDTDTFRERRLSPGRAVDREQVERNQRQRLFGAMVASVAERGYARTRVADLVEISGVSNRSFYGLFDDKQACFIATLDVLLSTTVDIALDAPWEGAWDDVARERLARFTELVVAEPAAARMCLIEAPVAGGEAAEMLDRAIGRAEELLKAAFQRSDERAQMPSEFATVGIGVILEIARTRLLRGKVADLLGAERELLAYLLAFRPPTGPLRSAGRLPGERDEESEAGDHAERAMRAFEALLREQSYAETTMEQIANRATMSVRTLYANFSSVEDVLLASIDSAASQVNAVTGPAARRNPDFAEGIRAAFVAFFGLLSSRPNLANLLLVGACEGGAPALTRRSEALRPLEMLFRSAQWGSELGRTGLAAEVVLGGVLALSRKRLRDSGAQGLLGLIPLCTYLALAPGLGAAGATTAAEGKSYRRRRESFAGELMSASTRLGSDRVLVALSSRPCAINDLVETTSLSPAIVAERLSELEAAGLVMRRERGTEEDTEPIYVPAWPWPTLGSEIWEDVDQADRERISADIGRAIQGEVEQAVEAKTFDSRPERHLVRMPMWVDEQGWRQLSAALDNTLETCISIQKEVDGRLKGGDPIRDGFQIRVVLVSFEMPGSPQE